MSNLEQALQAYHNGKTLVCFTHKHTILVNRSACPESVLLTTLKDTLKVRVL